MNEANSKLLVALNKYINKNKTSVKRVDTNVYSIKDVEIKYVLPSGSLDSSYGIYCIYISKCLIACYKPDDITNIVDNLTIYATQNADIIYENFLQILDND